MIRSVNVQNIIPTGTVMNANLTSAYQQVYAMGAYTIQVVWSGTPNGTFTLEECADQYSTMGPNSPTNWTTISGTNVTVSSDGGSYAWNMAYTMIPYNYVRLVYTDSSGGASTATITVSTVNAKGF